MKTLLSLPPNMVSAFSQLYPQSQEDFFVECDPEGSHVGSGGGTAWILNQFWKKNTDEKKILIHAGGMSRRLPSYATCGKIFTPIPVFRWKTGQRIDQTLLDIQLDFYKRVMVRANEKQNLLIASGDVLLRCSDLPASLPDVDVVVLATWTDSSIATRHGVFFAQQQSPHILDFMLQKPSIEKLQQLMQSHVFMMDTGCWILSDRAVSVLMKKCGYPVEGEKIPKGVKDFIPNEYDFYSCFGESLGRNPAKMDSEISSLTCALVNLEDGEFYHFGTSRELITSTERIQNIVVDPRNIYHKKVKHHGSVFLQNARVDITIQPCHKNIWIENSHIGKNWVIHQDSILTGIPENDWTIDVPDGVCLDIVPVKSGGYCLRPYGFDDVFKGKVGDSATLWMGKSLVSWFNQKGILPENLNVHGDHDIQDSPIFPVLLEDEMTKWGGNLLAWMIDSTCNNLEMLNLYKSSKKISATELLSVASIPLVKKQQEDFMKENLPILAKNHHRSVFYQCDLSHMVDLFQKYNLTVPEKLCKEETYISKIRNIVFRSQLDPQVQSKREAFDCLATEILAQVGTCSPKYTVLDDQIVWGRSPARFDLAGGWTDTPPYSTYYGGRVVNMAIDLNGQQPIQTYVRKITEPYFILRSIDTGADERVETFQQLQEYNTVGSSFSIPKAALSLAGFLPQFCHQKFGSLKEQLQELGGGLEITLLAAIPKGSGLGTSSILAATLLGTLSSVCSLGWDEQKICFNTLALEQLLTTGGGWQDQFGGVYGGIKLCSSFAGLQDTVQVRRLPSELMIQSDTSGLWLLYYTGITRVAKDILADIVTNMFLNNKTVLDAEYEIMANASSIADAIQFCDYGKVADCVKNSWNLNKQLDKGVSSSEIEEIIKRIDDYSLGYKLGGAGGGGYLLICAKDYEAVGHIHHQLETSPTNNRARFVRLSLNTSGLQITRS